MKTALICLEYSIFLECVFLYYREGITNQIIEKGNWCSINFSFCCIYDVIYTYQGVDIENEGIQNKKFSNLINIDSSNILIQRRTIANTSNEGKAKRKRITFLYYFEYYIDLSLRGYFLLNELLYIIDCSRLSI